LQPCGSADAYAPTMRTYSPTGEPSCLDIQGFVIQLQEEAGLEVLYM
jgi:hypothetical protein